MTVHTARRQGIELLSKAGLSVPGLTAEVLLAFAMQRDRSYLYAHPEEELTEVAWLHFGRYLHERLQHKPTQYITGRQEFYGREFRVNPDVLIPRPETEHLIEAALPLIRSGDRVLDVGTGSGAVAITLALETQAHLYATDVSIAALAVARENAARLGAAVQFLAADLASVFAAGCFDVAISNPPYVASDAELAPEVRDYEPHLALFAGATGNDVYDRLVPQAARVLKPGGHLLLELGSAPELPECWSRRALHRDLAGIERVLHAQKMS